jgi:hypothetical protein
MQGATRAAGCPSASTPATIHTWGARQAPGDRRRPCLGGGPLVGARRRRRPPSLLSTPPRPSVCKRRTRALGCQPGAGRIAGGEQPHRGRLHLDAPSGPHVLGLGHSAHQRCEQPHRCSQRRGTAIVKAAQPQASLPTRGTVARAPLALAAGRGEPHGHGEPVHRPHHDGALALVVERLGPLAHQVLLLSLPGVCLQSLLQGLPDQAAPKRAGRGRIARAQASRAAGLVTHWGAAASVAAQRAPRVCVWPKASPGCCNPRSSSCRGSFACKVISGASAGMRVLLSAPWCLQLRHASLFTC